MELFTSGILIVIIFIVLQIIFFKLIRQSCQINVIEKDSYIEYLQDKLKNSSNRTNRQLKVDCDLARAKNDYLLGRLEETKDKLKKALASTEVLHEKDAKIKNYKKLITEQQATIKKYKNKNRKKAKQIENLQQSLKNHRYQVQALKDKRDKLKEHNLELIVENMRLKNKLEPNYYFDKLKKGIEEYYSADKKDVE